MMTLAKHSHNGSFNYVLHHDTQVENGQDKWKWCNKCQSLAYAGFGDGVCPAGGKHDHNGSFNYVLHHDTQVENGQDKWKWCNKCQSLAYAGFGDGTFSGICPADGLHHNHDRSFNYVLHHDTQTQNGQDNWKWCNKCAILVFAGNPDQEACPKRRVPID